MGNIYTNDGRHRGAYLEHAGKAGMKWGYNNGRRNGNRVADPSEYLYSNGAEAAGSASSPSYSIVKASQAAGTSARNLNSTGVVDDYSEQDAVTNRKNVATARKFVNDAPVGSVRAMANGKIVSSIEEAYAARKNNPNNISAYRTTKASQAAGTSARNLNSTGVVDDSVRSGDTSTLNKKMVNEAKRYSKAENVTNKVKEAAANATKVSEESAKKATDWLKKKINK